MANVQHTCTGCAPIDASIMETYIALINTNESAKVAEAGRVVAETERVEAETQRTSTFATDHSRAVEDHSVAQSDHATAGSDHTTALSDHTMAQSDHATAGDDHTRAESDHSTAVSDHGVAGTDHTTATGDHTTASADHSIASTDHTTAEADHTTAGSDHTRAGEDHTLAAADHVTAEADHTTWAGYRVVVKSVGETAPASPSSGDKWYKTTDNKIYSYDGSSWDSGVAATTGATIVNSATNDVYVFNGASLFNNEAEVSQLEAKIYEIEGAELDLTNTLVFEQGGIATSNGTNQTSSKQIRTPGYIPAKKLTITISSSNGSVYVYGYNENGYVSALGWINGTYDFAIEGATKYRIVFKNASGTDLAPEDFSTLGATIKSVYEGLIPPIDQRVVNLENGVDNINEDKGGIIDSLLGKIAVTLGKGLQKADGVVYNSANYCCTDFVPINDADLVVRGASGTYITSLALYTANTVGSFIESSTTAFKHYTKAYLESVGAKYYRACFLTQNYENGAEYVVNYDVKAVDETINEKTINTPIVARCLDIQYNGNATVTMDVIYIYTNKNGLREIYCDGDSLNHSPKSYVFGVGKALLVLDSGDNIVFRANNSEIQVGDIVLLSYNTSIKFDGGGILYPSLFRIIEKNDVDALKLQARCLDLVVNSSSSVTMDVIYLYSKSGLTTVYADGTVYSHSPKTFTFGYPNAAILVADASGTVVQRLNNDAIQYGDVILLSYGSSVGFDGGLLFGEYLRVKLINNAPQTIDNGNALQGAKKVADSYCNGLTPLTISCDVSGYELPTTMQELAIQKKIEQLTSIRWTPLAPIANTDGSGTFPANTQNKGLPYSSVKECDKFIGFEVSVYTFMTAVNNPYSLLYTENVSADHSDSAWGKTYHGINSGTYYGLVCNVFATECIGFDVIWNTQQHEWQSNYLLNLIRIFEQSAQGLRIGDVVWRNGHDMIVYGIKRDSNGDVVGVKLAESSGLAHIDAEISDSDFDALLATHIVYRGMELFKNKYTPSPFVAIRDEVITPFVYNDDICCFAGDKACFREGDTIAINYNLKQVGTWTTMELYKEDDLLDTIVLDSSAHVVDLTSRNLAYGKYKARLTDGVNYSQYTEFEILQTTVSLSAQGNATRVTFSSSNGSPLYVRLCDIAGQNLATHEFTNEEISEGYCVVDFSELHKQQYNNTTIPTAYIKVFFKGDFGQVTNDPIQWN